AAPKPGGGGGEGQGLFRHTVSATPDEGGTAVLDFISSDATLDRYHEIISPAGWNLTSYQKKPVFQNAHQYCDNLFPLGKALVPAVRSFDGRQSLFQRVEFAVAANP